MYMPLDHTYDVLHARTSRIMQRSMRNKNRTLCENYSKNEYLVINPIIIIIIVLMKLKRSSVISYGWYCTWQEWFATYTHFTQIFSTCRRGLFSTFPKSIIRGMGAIERNVFFFLMQFSPIWFLSWMQSLKI